MDALDDELAKLGAILVEERVLRRIIKRHCRIGGLGLQVPHSQCYALPRADLERHVERGEVAVPLEALPEQVIVVRSERGALLAGKPEALSRLWRAIFHARVHQAYDALLGAKGLTAAAIRERVHRIGQTEFDEIRSVLAQERLLLPPVTEAGTYIEFAALYLELRQFAPAQIERTFPALLDPAQIDATLALDVDAAALLAASRPSRAPAQPLIEAPPSEAPRIEPVLERTVPSARKAAARARAKGNRTRAAILAARSGDLEGARGDLEELVARLGRAVGGAPAAGWVDALLPLVQVSATRRTLRFNAGARLLHDLLSACTVAEREVKVVDAVAWALSRGKRPIVRPLPATREVKIAKHVHAAEHKLPASGLAGPARDRLAAVLHAIGKRADDQVRRVLRPKLEAALEEVGLVPRSLPERVAERALVDELLDRAVEVGRLSLGDLRDALSRNELKLPDLTLGELRTGDPLLRADRLLADSLDGVYRRGESYMRGLQKLSSILFGTPVGRMLTRFALLPLVGSYMILMGLQHMVGPVSKRLFHLEPLIYTRESLAFGAVFLFLLMHVALFRRGVVLALRGLWRAVRLLLFDGPRWLWRIPLVQRIVRSLAVRWIVKPALPAALVWWLVPSWWRWPIAVAVYLALALWLNSRYGRRAEELGADLLVRTSRQLTGRIVPAFVRYVIELFARLVELFNRALYRVDEWLRFRTGQSVIALVAKGVFGAIWFVVSYVLRLYINLFVEPTTNPIKHFPVVTVAAKILLPFTESLLHAIAGPATHLLGKEIGNGFAAFTLLVLPGLAGFLVWELKENWKLYRATRHKTLRPRAIGHHGETMAQFLRPGFHSGTIPKLFTKLRRAAWKGDTRAVSKHKEGLHHVEVAVHKFADRQLVAMLDEDAAFRGLGLVAEHVEIGSNRVQIALLCPGVSVAPSTIRFELQSGWLVASIPALGWIAVLSARQRQIFETALAGFYKLAAVDLVREQLEHALQLHAGAAVPPYDIADEGLVVWPARGFEVEVVYNLRSPKLRPAVRGAEYRGEVIDLAGRHAMFGHESLYWSVWTTTWQQIARGEPPMRIIVGPTLLPTAAAPAAPGS